jgi:hypothetical protein
MEDRMPFNKIGEVVKGGVGGATQLLDSLKDQGKEKMLETLTSVKEVLPLLAEVGFIVESMSIDVSIPPEISLKFSKAGEVSAERVSAMLETHKNNEMLKAMVKALVAADDIQKRIAIANMRFANITLGMSLPPSVNISFVRKSG